MEAPFRKPVRRSVRLPLRAYDRPGRYYVTICTQAKVCLFGRVAYRRIRLNAPGRMVLAHWQALGERFDHVVPQEVVVMPNHLHGILWFREEPVGSRESLGDVMAAFKLLTTVAYIRGVKAAAWRGFDGRLWQRNYWERVLRDEEELMHARSYIMLNPVHWREDPLYPAVSGGRGSPQG